jgi:transcriptional regulator with XRE-family HTH domain
MSAAASLIKDARGRAGMTQAELGRRMGISQAAVARLERHGANPTVATLEKALAATGHCLVLDAPARPGVDVSLIHGHLELSPAERLRSIETMYAEQRKLALAGNRAPPPRKDVD